MSGIQDNQSNPVVLKFGGCCVAGWLRRVGPGSILTIRRSTGRAV